MENSFDNESLNESLNAAAVRPSNGAAHEVSPDDAASMYFADPKWKERFLARCDNERARLRAEAEEALLRAQEDLAALSEDAGSLPKAKPVAKARARAKPVARPVKRVAKRGTELDDAELGRKALAAIKDAGKEGMGTVRLGKMLGVAPGPYVAPLIAAGRVKAKGVKRGTTYFAVGST